MSFIAAAGVAVAGASIAAYGAVQRNKAISASSRSAKYAAGLQSRQIADQAATEREKRLLEAEQIIGRAKVAGAASGGGDYQSSINQAEIDFGRNASIIDRNRQSATDRTNSELSSTLTSLRANRQNLILSAFTGGLQGFSSGLSIMGAVNEFGAGRAGGAPPIEPDMQTYGPPAPEGFPQ
jgi:hypothetical protein